MSRIEKEMLRREEKFDMMIDRLEKNFATSFNKVRIDVENTLQKNELKVDEQYNDVKTIISSF